MSNWDRRALMQVADAIRNVLKDGALSEAQRPYVVALLQQAEAGSKTVETSSTQLIDIKLKLCTFVREQQLCHCENPAVWSHVCQFLAEVAAGGQLDRHAEPVKVALRV